MDCPNVLDFEASGFGSESYPIEVGYCLANGERFCKLIRPYPDWIHWDTQAEALHGIDRATLMAAGEDPVTVCQELNQRLGGLTLYSDGWVADKRWFDRLFYCAGVRPLVHLSPIENVQNECQHFIWDQVKGDLLQSTAFSRHRASSDAEFIQRVFQRTRQLCAYSRTG